MNNNDNQLEKKYGLLTAIAMVVGIVIGSGVFFKAEKVLVSTGGNLPQGLLAWLIGGMVMVVCAYNFAILATKYEKVNGIVDYAEVLVSSKYGYFFAWFMDTIYFPAMSSVLCWVTARYFCTLLGWDIVGAEAMTLAGFLLVLSFVINTLSPKIAGKMQVGTTFVKIIPLALMGVIGLFFGLKNGVLAQNFSGEVIAEVGENPLFTALVSTAFAYEGWICATSINAELKDAKTNLPKALTFGTIFVVLIYMLYYIGLAGSVENRIMMEQGETGVKLAFTTIFGNVGGIALYVFVIISCFGTLNGLMMASTRGFYSIAVRGEGPCPNMFSKVDEYTNMPSNSAVLGVLVTGIWLVYFYGANLTNPWFGNFSFDSSELPIITIYAMYIPIFFMQMKKSKDLDNLHRYVVPILGIIACLFMVVAAYASYGGKVFYYLLIYGLIMCIGLGLKNYKHDDLKK